MQNILCIHKSVKNKKYWALILWPILQVGCGIFWMFRNNYNCGWAPVDLWKIATFLLFAGTVVIKLQYDSMVYNMDLKEERSTFEW